MTHPRYILPLLLLALASARSEGQQLLYFTASWCGPCQQMAPTIAGLEREGVQFVKRDFDQRRAEATQLRVTSIPAFVAVDANRREVGRIVGGTSAGELRALWAKAQGGVQSVAAPEQSTPPHCRINVGDGSTGSGTLVSVDDGNALVVTCSHLFDQSQSGVTVTFTSGRRFQARVLRIDRGSELAALQIADPGVKPVPIADADPAGTLTAGGFGPNGSYRAVQGRIVGSTQSPQMAVNSTVMTGTVRPGDSGGGVFDASGAFVGVVWGTEGGSTYAVCGQPVRRFLDTVFPNRPGRIIPRSAPRSNGSAGGQPGYRPPNDINPGPPVEPSPGPGQPLEPPTQGTQPNPDVTAQIAALNARIDAIKQCDCDHTQRDHDIQLSLTAIQQINQRLTTIEEAKPIDIAAEIAKALDHDTPVRVYMPDGRLAGESKTNIFRGGAIDFTFNPRALLDAK